MNDFTFYSIVWGLALVVAVVIERRAA